MPLVTITSSGTWTAPAGIQPNAVVECWGDGANGETGGGVSGAGGRGGGYAKTTFNPVAAREYSTGVGQGNNSSTTYLYDPDLGAEVCSARSGVLGGNGVTGDVLHTGGAGGAESDAGAACGGGGGGVAGPIGNGQAGEDGNMEHPGAGGAPGASMVSGYGGQGGDTEEGGSNGDVPGGGGGGGGTNGVNIAGSGGAGARGEIRIMYTVAAAAPQNRLSIGLGMGL